MHSSGMRTGRSLTVCWILLSGGGGCLLQGVSAPGGSAPGVSVGGVCFGGCLLWGCLFRGHVCSQGGVCYWRGVCGGVSAPGGCGIPACTEADTPPVDRITDTSKNITLATTSLRLVKNTSSHYF